MICKRHNSIFYLAWNLKTVLARFNSIKLGSPCGEKRCYDGNLIYRCTDCATVVMSLELGVVFCLWIEGALVPRVLDIVHLTSCWVHAVRHDVGRNGHVSSCALDIHTFIRLAFRRFPIWLTIIFRVLDWQAIFQSLQNFWGERLFPQLSFWLNWFGAIIIWVKGHVFDYTSWFDIVWSWFLLFIKDISLDIGNPSCMRGAEEHGNDQNQSLHFNFNLK